eukprot:CAMPEP_0115724178 /NCGR_PEP_ID=MMETSP0272-20121206/80641_1 /TAXON_ID=71861 /ORGANISM="Scrippsiella trochoidea, Strain CCMP3099" /LENGTH=95 /DNA_ID=CAMNT_0003167387 /DNA_START=26 /DNA_END=313 /DNA_ORIENTATION=-
MNDGQVAAPFFELLEHNEQIIVLVQPFWFLQGVGLAVDAAPICKVHSEQLFHEQVADNVRSVLRFGRVTLVNEEAGMAPAKHLVNESTRDDIVVS